jgi:hypothetical protein
VKIVNIIDGMVFLTSISMIGLPRLASRVLQLEIALADHVRRREFLTTRLMMGTGDVLRGDMSFKITKKVYCEGSKYFECAYTVMNEFNEVLGTWFCINKSLKQVTFRRREIAT